MAIVSVKRRACRPSPCKWLRSGVKNTFIGQCHRVNAIADRAERSERRSASARATQLRSPASAQAISESAPSSVNQKPPW